MAYTLLLANLPSPLEAPFINKNNNLDFRMDKKVHPLQNVERNYLAIPKLQRRGH